MFLWTAQPGGNGPAVHRVPPYDAVIRRAPLALDALPVGCRAADATQHAHDGRDGAVRFPMIRAAFRSLISEDDI